MSPRRSPRVASVYFGINYDFNNLDPGVKKGMCAPANSLEAPDANWPGDPSGLSGNSVGFGSPVIGNHLFPFYYFQVDDFSGGPPAVPFLCSGINPLGGYAAFLDDSAPAVTDDVTRFGCVKWYSDTGSNVCPIAPPTGACCLSSGTEALCQIVNSKNECDALSGTYQGDNTLCENHPCSACCYWFGSPALRYCVVTTETDCLTGTWSTQLEPDGFGHTVGSNWAWVPSSSTAGLVCTSDPSLAGTMWYCQDPRDVNPSSAVFVGKVEGALPIVL